MNFTLVTIITVALLVHEGKGKFFRVDGDNEDSHPCERKKDRKSYKLFVLKHILKETFGRDNKTNWSRYQ